MLKYERSLPPEVDISGYHDCRVVSLYDTSKLDFNQDKKRQVYKDAYLSMTDNLLNSLSKDLGLPTGFNQLYGYDSLLSDTLIEDLTDTLDNDMLVIVQSFDLERDKEVVVTEDEDGDKVRTAYYTLICKSEIICVNANREVVFNRSIHASDLIDERSVLSGLLAIGPSVGNHGKTANKLAKNVASQFLGIFFPSQILITRTYYSAKDLKGVKPLFKAQDWLQAEKFLLDLWDKKDPELEKKIAHNLALVYEAKGNMVEYKKWVARGKKPNDFFREGVEQSY
ncbi:hypothetical protein FNH22_16810 [Fulvivirga sp. M361]|uniref:DUF6340 family protein n=1 Tax=Fulvivirga sp. M361 TaxID=2594266 RepID=UPI00117BCC2A|nr:DUF6340 family protein [Fulvivirga sp. M361]TRX56299.1 hypothetical protein FNH22_16810 [Fulvivirga sp. M361]